MPSEKNIREDLEELVKARDFKIKSKFEHLKTEFEEADKQGKEKQKELDVILKAQKLNIGALDTLDKKLERAAKAEIKKIKEKLEKEGKQPSNEGPAIIQGLSFSGHTYQYLTPYYTKIYYSDGRVPYAGYYSRNVDVGAHAWGGGWGCFGTGVGWFKVYVDRWYFFRPDTSRYYTFNVYEPYRGYVIVKADDAWYTCKYAKAVISSRIQAHQYNWKPELKNTVYSLQDDNINANYRYDNTRLFYYSALFGGGDYAYLLVNQSFYVYARGSGSYSELNFSSGSANYLPAPYVYVH